DRAATTAPTTSSPPAQVAALRIALVHNDRAGYGVYSSGDLVQLLSAAGNEIELFKRDKPGLAAAIAARPDVVVASGGDGTIARVAIALRDSDIPLYILPTGTSNNIARGVGADGAIPKLVTQLVPRAQAV